MTRRPGMLTGVLVCIILSLFEAWFLGALRNGVSHSESRGNLVDSYAEALALRKPYLLTPTAKLVDLPLDQQPPTDPRRRILDASYFRGKYYAYYGILPFLIALAPWKAATGSFLNAETYIAGALIAGNFLICFSFLRLWLSSPTKQRELAAAFGIAIAILCSGSFNLMDNPEIHEVESATAYLLNCAVLFGLVGFEESGRLKVKYLSLAVGSAGLLMACRPNQIFTPALISGLAIVWLLRANMSRRRKIRILVAIFSVPVATAAGLGFYNYIRFGSISEFGMNYGTGAIMRVEVIQFSINRVPYNLYHYFFGLFQTLHYFPFIGGPLHPDKDQLPLYHDGLDQVYGILITCPALLLCIYSFYRHKILSIVLIVSAAGSLFFLSGLGFGTYRYLVDFAAFFAAAAGIGAMEFCSSEKIDRFGLRRGIVSILTVASGFGAICVATSIAVVHGLFDVRRPQDFSTLARPFNLVRYQYEKTLGPGPRFIALELKLPDRIGAVEPLLVTGRAGLQDFIYIHYADAGSIRIGFESMGRGGPVSLPIPIDYKKTHRMDLILGNEMPPPDHPLFLGRSAQEVESLYHILKIYIDGKAAFQARVEFHPDAGYEYIGYSPFDAAFGSKFTGQVKEVKGISLKNYLRESPTRL